MDNVYESPDLICTRCSSHTGNNSQGHFWQWCKVTKTFEEFHFCCPGNCSLHPPTKPEFIRWDG